MSSPCQDFLAEDGCSPAIFYKQCQDALDDKFAALFEAHEHHWYAITSSSNVFKSCFDFYFCFRGQLSKVCGCSHGEFRLHSLLRAHVRGMPTAGTQAIVAEEISFFSTTAWRFRVLLRVANLVSACIFMARM